MTEYVCIVYACVCMCMYIFLTTTKKKLVLNVGIWTITYSSILHNKLLTLISCDDWKFAMFYLECPIPFLFLASSYPSFKSQVKYVTSLEGFHWLFLISRQRYSIFSFCPEIYYISFTKLIVHMSYIEPWEPKGQRHISFVLATLTFPTVARI